MSTFPFAVRGSRAYKKLRSLDTVKSNWDTLWDDPEIEVADTTEEGLTDPIEKINMAATAEICAQRYEISREEQDTYALESFRKALSAEKGAFYSSHVSPFMHDGKTLLERDEYPFLRESLTEKPAMMGKAPTLFDGPSASMRDFYKANARHLEGKMFQEKETQGTITLFNACARSDGAAAVVVASEEKAKELGLDVLVKIRSWGFWGNNPAVMGISPAFAAKIALERAGLSFDELDQIELHEAFAATCLSIFHVGKASLGHDWRKKYADGKINPNGGTLALGHPLAATGARLLLNLIYGMKTNPTSRFGMAAACASGGLGGAMILEKA
jgi:acetyl-CoA C-acetyltransferase